MSYIQIIFLTIANLKSCTDVYCSVSNSTGLGREEGGFKECQVTYKGQSMRQIL